MGDSARTLASLPERELFAAEFREAIDHVKHLREKESALEIQTKKEPVTPKTAAAQ